MREAARVRDRGSCLE